MNKHMRFLKLLSVLILLVSCFAVSSVYAARVKTITNQPLMQMAATLPNKGILRQEEGTGYIYLEVSPVFIDKLFPLLNIPNLTKNKPEQGAHITVLREQEVRRHRLFDIPEIGKIYSFKVVSFDKVQVTRCVHDNDGRRTWYVLQLDAPELTALREKYGYSPRRFHPHISIAFEQEVFEDRACPYERYRYEQRPYF